MDAQGTAITQEQICIVSSSLVNIVFTIILGKGYVRDQIKYVKMDAEDSKDESIKKLSNIYWFLVYCILISLFILLYILDILLLSSLLMYTVRARICTL